MKIAKETVEEFFEIPIGVTEELVQDLAAGLEHIFQDYITFVASCGNSFISYLLYFSKSSCLASMQMPVETKISSVETCSIFFNAFI